MNLIKFYLFAALAAPSAFGAAKTIVQERDEAAKRLLPLRKITVGPDDQYAAAIDPTGKYLVYARKAELAPHLEVQDLASGEASELLPVTADSQEPAFSKSGRLAFTYYKNSARGDVCFTLRPIASRRPLAPTDFQCLARAAGEADSERANPFWIAEDEIGFLSRDIAAGGQRRIRAQKISGGGGGRTLAEGQVWAPAMAPGGRWLAFNEIVFDRQPSIGRRALTLLDVRDGQRASAFFDLPGFSGFPAVSADEAYVYFSHYLDDTNGDDQIDGADNAVVFRAPVAQIVANKGDAPIFPEQLTSVESSCSYPRPYQNKLYLTCAFEGSLDVYSVASSGSAPAAWNAATLRSALQTSRSYQDRILIVNALRARGALDGPTADRMLLVNHALADDSAAAAYYAAKAEAAGDRPFYRLLRDYLNGIEARKREPEGEPSRETQAAIAALIADASKVAGEDGFRATTRGHLYSLLGRRREARAQFESARAIQARSTPRPFARALWFELGARELAADPDALDAAYATMMRAPELDEQARVYYAFQFLRTAQVSESSLSARAERVARVRKRASGPPATLLESEEAVLRLTQAPNDQEKSAIYREMEKTMALTAKDYFLRRALYVRAILNFTAAAEFRYMSLVASAWLKYTDQDDTEYAYAREVFSRASLEEAYGFLAKGQTRVANGFFYESLSLTDDLESHEGFVNSSVALGERKNVDQYYANLRKRSFIGDNMKFVEALLILVDRDRAALEGAGGASGQPTDALDAALSKLAAMTQDRDSPARRLLLGYCYASKLMRAANGLDFDAKLLDDAHRELMLAYDVGRANARIAASAAMNLGLLHARVQNYALAARFYALRKRYPFASADAKWRFEALYAQALHRSRQSDLAADELADLDSAQPPPIRERRAFYLLAAGRYDEAARAYEKVWPELQKEGDLTLARVGVAYGLSAMKSKAKTATNPRPLLMQAAARASKLKPIKKGGDRAVDFDPKRVELAAYGLLGQVGSAAERAQALETRQRILSRSPKSIDKADAVSALNETRLAAAYAEAGDARRARGELLKAAVAAKAVGRSSSYLAETVSQTACEIMAFALAHPDVYRGDIQDDVGAVAGLVAGFAAAHDALKAPAPFADLQRAKLEILHAAFDRRIAKAGDRAKPDLKAPYAERARKASPEAWKDVERLEKSL